MSEPVRLWRYPDGELDRPLWSRIPGHGATEWLACPAAEFDALTARADKAERELREALAMLKECADRIREGHAAYCDEAWTDRGLHSPSCQIDEVDMPAIDALLERP